MNYLVRLFGVALFWNILKTIWERYFSKTKHQAGDPETEFVGIYKFVKHLVQLFGVASFWNTSLKLYREDTSLEEKHQTGDPETSSRFP